MGQFKYQELIDSLIGEITSGKLKPGARIPPPEELGERFSMSTITVTRALNELGRRGYIRRVKGRGSFVRESTGLSGAAGLRDHCIHCILPFDASQTDLIRSIESTCQEQGYLFMIRNSRFSSETERELILQARASGTDGIIVYPVDSLDNLGVFSRMAIDRYPFVVIDRKLAGVEHPFVSCANEEAFYRITDYLCGKGHERIAFVCGDMLMSSIRERFMGYCHALIDHRLPVERELIVDRFYVQKDSPYAEKIQGMLKQLRSLSPRVTAVACANDLTASLILQQTDKIGIRVPDDLSVTGFDNMYFSSLLTPPLTTMRQPFNEIGRNAVLLLIDMIKGATPHTREVRCPADLVERESVAAVPPGDRSGPLPAGGSGETVRAPLTRPRD